MALFNPFEPPAPRPPRVTLAAMRAEFARLGYEAHLRFDMTQPGAAELEIRGGGLTTPVRFRGSMVMSRAWAQKHEAMLALVRRYRGSTVSQRFVL